MSRTIVEGGLGGLIFVWLCNLLTWKVKKAESAVKSRLAASEQGTGRGLDGYSYEQEK